MAKKTWKCTASVSTSSRKPYDTTITPDTRTYAFVVRAKSAEAALKTAAEDLEALGSKLDDAHAIQIVLEPIGQARLIDDAPQAPPPPQPTADAGKAPRAVRSDSHGGSDRGLPRRLHRRG